MIPNWKLESGATSIREYVTLAPTETLQVMRLHLVTYPVNRPTPPSYYLGNYQCRWI